MPRRPRWLIEQMEEEARHAPGGGCPDCDLMRELPHYNYKIGTVPFGQAWTQGELRVGEIVTIWGYDYMARRGAHFHPTTAPMRVRIDVIDYLGGEVCHVKATKA